MPLSGGWTRRRGLRDSRLALALALRGLIGQVRVHRRFAVRGPWHARAVHSRLALVLRAVSTGRVGAFIASHDEPLFLGDGDTTLPSGRRLVTTSPAGQSGRRADTWHQNL